MTEAEPLAFAAVRFDLPSGTSPVALTLTVAPDGLTTPGAELTVCALTTGFEPADGGPMTDAPAYDCDNQETSARVDDSFRFDVGDLVRDGPLELAVLPASTLDRLTLETPGDDALEVRAARVEEAVGSDGRAESGSTSGAVDGRGPSAPPGPLEGVPPTRADRERPGTLAPPLGADRAPDSGETTSAPAGAPSDAPGAAMALQAASTGADGGSAVLLAVLLAALVVAGALWTAAGRERAWSDERVG